MKFMFFILSLSLIFSKAQAWSERGHHLICEVAAVTVKDPNLKKFLATRTDLMGHLCNIPDISWRSLGGSALAGNAAHFLDPETVGLTPAQVPVHFAEYLAYKKTDESPAQKANALGSLWWRAEQFFNLAVKEGSTAAHSPTPASPMEQQNNDLVYNKAIYNFMTDLGLMGHFVGDASMPYHNSADYDGWGTGHGGIHAFYEGTCVASYDLKLISEVQAQADHLYANNRFINLSVIETIKQVSVTSYAEKSNIEILDAVTAPSKITLGQQGIQLKTPATRLSPELACPAFKPLITTQLARSAAALAGIWEKAYHQAGSPDLNSYASYKYPLVPEFINLDYVAAVAQ